MRTLRKYLELWIVLASLNAVPTVIAQCVPAPSGLIAWWPANGNASDVIGGNNGTLSNGVTYVPGKVGQAFAFTSSSQMVVIPNSSSLQVTTNFTFEAWVKRGSATIASSDPTASGGYPIMFGYGYFGYNFGMAPQGALILSQCGVGGVFSGAGVTDTNWHHIAVTTSAGTVVFYVDGAPITTATFNPTYQFTTPVAISGRADNINKGNNDSFLGAIDEMSVYNRALSAAEIQGIYDAGSAGKCLPLPNLPAITGQPASATTNQGGSVIFEVVATGAPPLSYQWQFNGRNLPGATNQVLALYNILTNQAGTYDVIVANEEGAAVSSNAILTVVVAPTIARQPVNIITNLGSGVTFTVGATGLPPASYQWQANGAPIVAATTASFTLASTVASNAGYYSVTVSNIAGSVASSAASLTFLDLKSYAVLSLAGTAGSNFAIEALPALGQTNWAVLTNLILGAQPYLYIDYNSSSNSQQFYRAVLTR